MVGGGIFRYFGSSQHNKNTYWTSFETQLKIWKANNDVTDWDQIINFPYAIMQSSVSSAIFFINALIWGKPESLVKKFYFLHFDNAATRLIA